ncbi:MAG TPA: ATP-binding protein [Steroidobacteraceae bacterium]|nr:ATP-binding protein [Steroidobacteraceae bacterium]
MNPVSVEAAASADAAAHAAPGRLVRLWRSVALGPLEQRLFWIVVAGLLPLILVSFATLLYSAQAQKRQQIQTAADTMRSVMAAVDAEFRASLASLDALAASPRLQARDFAGFDAEARALLERRPSWANIVLSDPTSQHVINARLPPESPLPRAVDPGAVEATVRAGVPGVGNLIWSPVLKMYVFAVRLPIREGDKIPYVLTAVLRPEAVLEIVKRHVLPKGATAVVLDKRRVVVARTLNHTSWVGKPPSQTLLSLLDSDDERASAITTTLEGVPVYTVYHRSPESGWWAAIGIPTHIVDAPVIRSYLLLGGSILVSVMLGLSAAFFTGRTVTGPMRKLERAASAVARGEAPVPPETDLPEIRQAVLALLAAHIEREKLLHSERQARLLEQNARLAAELANKTKDEFLAMLGHELRNPLAAIATAAQVLDHSEHTQRKDAEQHAKAIIRRQVRHLSKLTDDLLDAARVMMGKIVLERRPIDLAQVARNTVDTMRNTGQLLRHECTTQLEPAWINADPTRIDQVVANLLTNAVKYTPPPGRIEVSVRREQGEARFSVRDSGLGLEPELLTRIFDLFVQGERGLDRSQGGLGIGLTLVRRIAELHGGRVEARSAGAGKGSEFIVQLPAIDAPPDMTEPVPTTRRSARRRIVLVEDNDDVRAGLRVLLEMEGHEVLEANDGLQGVDTILREQADIAVIDIGLPQLDGYGVARAVRSRARHPVMLIAMTGYGSRGDAERGTQAGFDAYMVKPVDAAVMNELIARVTITASQ